MAFTVNVRMMLPKEKGLLTADGEEFIGHYDLQTYGNVRFYGMDFTNPVFSYRAKSYLDIFSLSDSSKIYSGGNYTKCNVYKWPFTINNDALLDEFYDKLRGVIDKHDPYKKGKALRCTIKAGNVFHEYKLETTNCFHAVATWLYAMGDYTLKTVYDAAHDKAYLKYSAERTAQKYADNCSIFNPDGSTAN